MLELKMKGSGWKCTWLAFIRAISAFLLMLNRTKILLYLLEKLQESGGKLSKTNIDKILFVTKMEYPIGKKIKFYNFYPYLHGPFSANFYFDLSKLQSLALISEEYRPTAKGKIIANKIGSGEKEIVNAVVSRFASNSCFNYVYQSYPGYTVNSKHIPHEQKKSVPGIFTIGYQNKDIDSFLDKVIQNSINMVIDIRSNPFSMNYVFTKRKLSSYLEKVKIEYRHLPELGVDSAYRKDLESKKNFQKLRDHYNNRTIPDKQNLIQEIITLGKQKRVALLCFEENQQDCHRGILSRYIEKLIAEKITHI